MILKSEIYHFHRLDLTRQAGFIVTIYDEDGLRLAATTPCLTPAEASMEALKIVDNRGTEEITRATPVALSKVLDLDKLPESQKNKIYAVK